MCEPLFIVHMYIAWIGSTACGLSGITGPLTSWILSQFGGRLAVTVGCLLCSISLLMSSFVTRIEFLFISFSLMFGFGNSLIYTTSICCLGDNFERFLHLHACVRIVCVCVCNCVRVCACVCVCVCLCVGMYV